MYIENQATGKTRSCNVKDIVLEPPVELLNIDMQFGRAGKFINHPANIPIITLADWRWIVLVNSHLYINCTHHLFGIDCMIALINTTQDNRESVLGSAKIKWLFIIILYNRSLKATKPLKNHHICFHVLPLGHPLMCICFLLWRKSLLHFYFTKISCILAKIHSNAFAK